MRRRRAGLSVVLISTLVAMERASSPRPQPCPGGRYLVAGDALVTGDSSGPMEPVVIGAQTSIGNVCASVHAKLKVTRRRTTVLAIWSSCAALEGRVTLKASLDRSCATLTGRLVAKRSKLRKRFVARASRCGDGILDRGNGEECDGGSCAGGGTCTADCTCMPLPSPTTTTTVSAPPDDSCTGCLLDPVPCNAGGLDARVCLARTHQTAAQVAGLTVALAYPPPLSIPGSGLAPTVRQRVMDLTGGVGVSFVSDRDQSPADGVDDTVRNAYATTAPKTVPFGPFELIHFDCPEGTLVQAHDLGCTIPDASDSLGDPIVDPKTIPLCLVGVAPHGGTPNVDCPAP